MNGSSPRAGAASPCDSIAADCGFSGSSAGAAAMVPPLEPCASSRKVALVVISDRGDLYLPGCRASVDEHVQFPFCQIVVVADPEHTMTASGAVDAGWRAVADADFVLHLEEDFVFTGPVDIEAMAAVLDAEEQLAHLVLKRQAWSPEEVAAGGVIECDPAGFFDRDTEGHRWVEHRKWFSLNPSLVPRRVFEHGFPEGSEPAMTQRLLDKGFHFGFWGHSADPPRSWHVGEVRAAGSVR